LILLLPLLKTMRPRQWTKNIFCFGALVFDGKLFHVPSLVTTIIGFVLLCLISGTVYIVNDLVDAEKDRLHPQKKYRPIASGALSKQAATASAILLPFIVLPLSFWLDIGFGLWMVIYLLLQLAYSFKLKNMVIIDVMAVASGFVIRVAAGVALIDVARFSPWLYVCITLLALFMAFGKRRQELVLATETGTIETRSILSDYSIALLDEIMAVVVASLVMAYSLYTFSAPNLPDNNIMMITIPFVMYGVFRYMYLIHICGDGGDPSELILQDRSLHIAVLSYGVVVVLILYQARIGSIFGL
jgi:4-hydroxybenzoate polyprenyltransferase